MSRRNKLFAAVVLLPFTFTITPALFAATIRGVVLSSGEPGKRWTTVTFAENQPPTKICAGGLNHELMQLPGAVVEVIGTEQKPQGKIPACFGAESYTIEEVAPGRPAITGVLTKVDKNSYAVINKSGRKWVLASMSPGMKELLKQEIVCDLVANDASNGQTTWLVARAFAVPTND
jgi:hypothetical protein